MKNEDTNFAQQALAIANHARIAAENAKQKAEKLKTESVQATELAREANDRAYSAEKAAEVLISLASSQEAKLETFRVAKHNVQFEEDLKIRRWQQTELSGRYGEIKNADITLIGPSPLDEVLKGRVLERTGDSRDEAESLTVIAEAPVVDGENRPTGERLFISVVIRRSFYRWTSSPAGYRLCKPGTWERSHYRALPEDVDALRSLIQRTHPDKAGTADPVLFRRAKKKLDEICSS